MTSDAKIGLLLGLVFIFVIAFVINGLPSLRPPISRTLANPTVSSDETFTSITGPFDQAVTGMTEPLDQPKTGVEPAKVETPRSVVQELPPSQPTPPPQTANNESVRSILPLPGFDKLLKELTPTVQNDQVNTINMEVPKPAPEAPAVGTRPPVAAAPQPRPEPAPASGLLETATNVLSQDLPKPATVTNKPPVIPGSKSYVVAQGDTLPAIAKRMYGPEEGNRMVNIDRIFQANLGILKSPSLVVVGQKLIIPPLPKPTGAAAPASAPAPTPVARTTTPADVLPSALFEKPKTTSESMTISEKVESLAKRAAATTPAPTAGGRWYTIQDGDSLWKIASSQLGAGSRWDEIYKLNSDVLPSQDSSLKPGAKLRLPAK